MKYLVLAALLCANVANATTIHYELAPGSFFNSIFYYFPGHEDPNLGESTEHWNPAANDLRMTLDTESRLLTIDGTITNPAGHQGQLNLAWQPHPLQFSGVVNFWGPDVDHKTCSFSSRRNCHVSDNVDVTSNFTAYDGEVLGQNIGSYFADYWQYDGFNTLALRYGTSTVYQGYILEFKGYLNLVATPEPGSLLLLGLGIPLLRRRLVNARA